MMPLVSLRKRYGLALGIMVTVLVLGVAAVWNKGRPVYAVTATVYVAQHFVSILKDSKELEFVGSQAFKQFMEQQVLTIGRYDILIDALRKMGDRRFVWQLPGESDRRAAERLQAALMIKTVKDTYMITVRLESENPDGLDLIVNTVLDTYFERARQLDSFFARDERLGALRQRRQKIVAAMNETVTRRARIGEQLGVTTFLPSAINPYDQILLESQLALTKAQRERIATESSLAVFEGKAGEEAIAAAALDSVRTDAVLNSLKTTLNQRRDELLRQLSGLEERHPLVAQIRQELEVIDDELRRAGDEAYRSVARSLVEQRRSEVRRARQIEAELDKQIVGLRQKAASFSILYNQGLALNDELDRSRKQLDALDSRIDFFEMESQAPGFIRIDSYARAPEIPIKGGRRKLLILVAVAAVGLGAGIPIALDVLDPRIRTPKQVEKIIGHPPMAGLLAPSEDLAVRRVRSDQLRRLAVALDRERTAHGNRIVLLSSIKSGAGVTGLAFELAQELRQLGANCLVVETNPLKPDARYGADRLRPGLLDLLVESMPATAAVVPAEQSLPDRVGVGFALDPHLFAYPSLRRRLDELKGHYDLILLDAPPILLSGDSEYLAGVADITLILIGAGQIVPGELRRAATILQKIDPPVLGFILTDLPIYKGGGYFGTQVKEYAAAEAAARAALKSGPLGNART